ncbi:MAG: AsmA family protein, partial [Alphaproteobacteria bacterium]|nr:AsmA family protein [Alphaproteobacteria bacterium]
MTTEILGHPRSDDRPSEAAPRRGRRAALITGGVFLGLALLIAFVVSIWNWNWFRGPLARVLSARMHREVTITGDLNANIWSWNPTASVQGLHIANPAWAGKGHMADIGRVVVRLRLVPLFSGHLDLRRLEFDNPSVDLWRDRQG